MKRTLLLASLLLAFLSCFSQVTEEMPMSWKLSVRSDVSVIELPPLDLGEITEQDSINDLDKSLPWRYGISRSVELDMSQDGEWTDVSNIGRIWRAAIKSPDAINLSINFENFYLPEGATLHLYNEDRSDISRTYSNAQNRQNNQVASWYISGDVIWIEYFVPNYVTEEAQLEIGSIIHGYRLGRIRQYVQNNRGLNDSGDCNYDVNCSIGADFDEKKDVIKKTVALLTLGNGYLCSASLMNNTGNDKTPYLLTANHCLEISDPAFWTIRFNWMSPNPVCGNGEDSDDLQTNFTMSGAELKASNELSDFALVEMFSSIPESWDIAFAGWDNTDVDPEFEVGIHHPNGDIMKICRDDSGAVKENANGTEVWLIGGVSVGTGNGWEYGTTESGSSGSPLFDQNGRVIGQLYAGQSFCDGEQNNDDYDIYGRFAVSWDSGASQQTRLRDWLDPNNSGATTLETIQNILNVTDNEFAGTLEIYPNPAINYITVMNNKYPNLSYTIFNLMGQKLKQGSLSNTENMLSVESFDEGVYFLYLEDNDSEANITKKIIVGK
jgi:lysyl endopeptidase